MSESPKIYVASSWRNDYQPGVVLALRERGYEAYDFRNPHEADNGFGWSEIDPAWKEWTPKAFRAALSTQPAQRGFSNDYGAMLWAQACVLVMPCGRSAHLEAGWFAGRRRPLFILIPEGEKHEPELMYLMADSIAVGLAELFEQMRRKGVAP